ncbi:MAG TPA: hypothetical protein VLW65_01260 [Bryobacteraceae bacterium]|nr:hypothetical protein [Bryobacteraceae bacterium]
MLLRTRFQERPKPAARDFPLALEMQYHVVGGPERETRGAGRTLWMSSREVIFETERTLPAGTELEILVSWPALLEDRIGLQLWIRGFVLHTLSHGMTAGILKYQFRTRALVRAEGAHASSPACPLSAHAETVGSR